MSTIRTSTSRPAVRTQRSNAPKRAQSQPKTQATKTAAAHTDKHKSTPETQKGAQNMMANLYGNYGKMADGLVGGLAQLPKDMANSLVGNKLDEGLNQALGTKPGDTFNNAPYKVAQGVAASASSTIGGLGSAIAHPLETGQALLKGGQHALSQTPDKTIGEVGHKLTEGYEQTSKVQGPLAGAAQVFTDVLGLKGMGKAAEEGALLREGSIEAAKKTTEMGGEHIQHKTHH